MNKLAEYTRDAASRLVVRSALNPLLWCAGIVGIPILILAVTVVLSMGSNPFVWALFLLGAIPVLTVCGVAVRFALVSPESLQSEDFQLRNRSLQMLQGTDSPRVLDVVEAVANPHASLKELAAIGVETEIVDAAVEKGQA